MLRSWYSPDADEDEITVILEAEIRRETYQIIERESRTQKEDEHYSDEET